MRGAKQGWAFGKRGAPVAPCLVLVTRFPLIETESPSKISISIIAASVIPTTEWPSSPEYLKTCMELRPVDPPKMATDKSLSSLSGLELLALDDFFEATTFFFFFFDFLAGSSSTATM